MSIPVVAGAIGVRLGVIQPPNYVALVAAGLLSVVVFPLLAIPRLGRRDSGSRSDEPANPHPATE